VIEEGLPGRTTVWDDAIEGAHKNGKTYLLPCLESHDPIDLVILMLGTNDLKTRFSLTAADIAAGAGALADMILKSKVGPAGRAPQVLLVSPILVGDNVGEFAQGAAAFGLASPQISREFRGYFLWIAATLGCAFIDATEYADPSPNDAIHLEAGEHQKLALAIAHRVQALFSNS
jgi:lysophospholipase L1-like esterase